MKTYYSFEALLEKAKNYSALGHDNLYIGNQLAELEVGQDMIHRVIEKLKSSRKTENRNAAKWLMLSGTVLLIVGFLLNILSINHGFNFGILLWIIPLIGIITSIKGIGKSIGL